MSRDRKGKEEATIINAASNDIGSLIDTFDNIAKTERDAQALLYQFIMKIQTKHPVYIEMGFKRELFKHASQLYQEKIQEILSDDKEVLNAINYNGDLTKKINTVEEMNNVLNQIDDLCIVNVDNALGLKGSDAPSISLKKSNVDSRTIGGFKMMTPADFFGILKISDIIKYNAVMASARFDTLQMSGSDYTNCLRAAYEKSFYALDNESSLLALESMVKEFEAICYKFALTVIMRNHIQQQKREQVDRYLIEINTTAPDTQQDAPPIIKNTSLDNSINKKYEGATWSEDPAAIDYHSFLSEVVRGGSRSLTVNGSLLSKNGAACTLSDFYQYINHPNSVEITKQLASASTQFNLHTGQHEIQAHNADYMSKVGDVSSKRKIKSLLADSATDIHVLNDGRVLLVETISIINIIDATNNIIGSIPNTAYTISELTRIDGQWKIVAKNGYSQNPDILRMLNGEQLSENELLEKYAFSSTSRAIAGLSGITTQFILKNKTAPDEVDQENPIEKALQDKIVRIKLILEKGILYLRNQPDSSEKLEKIEQLIARFTDAVRTRNYDDIPDILEQLVNNAPNEIVRIESAMAWLDEIFPTKTPVEKEEKAENTEEGEFVQTIKPKIINSPISRMKQIFRVRINELLEQPESPDRSENLEKISDFIIEITREFSLKKENKKIEKDDADHDSDETMDFSEEDSSAQEGGEDLGFVIDRASEADQFKTLVPSSPFHDITRILRHEAIPPNEWDAKYKSNITSEEKLKNAINFLKNDAILLQTGPAIKNIVNQLANEAEKLLPHPERGYDKLPFDARDIAGNLLNKDERQIKMANYVNAVGSYVQHSLDENLKAVLKQAQVLCADKRISDRTKHVVKGVALCLLGLALIGAAVAGFIFTGGAATPLSLFMLKIAGAVLGTAMTFIFAPLAVEHAKRKDSPEVKVKVSGYSLLKAMKTQKQNLGEKSEPKRRLGINGDPEDGDAPIPKKGQGQ